MTQNVFLRLLTLPIAENYVPVTNREAVRVYRRLREDSVVRFTTEPSGIEDDCREVRCQREALVIDSQRLTIN